MKKILLFMGAAIFCLSSSVRAADELQISAAPHFGTPALSGDCVFTYDESAAAGSEFTCLHFNNTATNCLNGQGGWSAFVGSESDPTALLTEGTDNVKDTHIDWGSGAGQVNYTDVGSDPAWDTVTTRDADATPLVVDHGIYSLTNTGALTVTDFVDVDGDHSDFVSGDQIILILSDADITLDCSENANLECFGGNDFTASATQITASYFIFDGTRWVGPSMPMSSPTTLALKTVQAGLNVITDNDGRALSSTELNSIVLTSGAADYDIPTGSCDDASEYGVWVTLKATGAVVPSLTSADASDLFVLANGTALDAGDELDLAGASGNSCYVVCTGSHTWRVMGEVGTCADGGAAD